MEHFTEDVNRLLKEHYEEIIQQEDWWGELGVDIDVNFYIEDDERVIHATVYHIDEDGYYSQIGESMAFPREH